MNTLKITINPYNTLNTASLNGHPLSPYSELNNFSNTPFWEWAWKFWDAAEREINDYFDLTIVAEDFETLFFQDMAKTYNICKCCTSEPFSFHAAPSKRFNAVCQLAQMYQLHLDINAMQVPLYAENFPSADSSFKKAPLHDALFIITDDIQIIDTPDQLQELAFILYPSEVNEITHLGKARYLWKITPDRIDDILRTATERFALIPFLINASGELGKNLPLSSHDRQTLELANSIEPLVQIGNLDRLAVGARVSIPVQTIPANAPVPHIRIVPLTPDIVEVNGLSIRAINSGETTLNIYKNDEPNAFCQKVIETYLDNTVKMITLDRKEPCMGIGRTQQIDIAVTPADATDASFIVWTVDKPDIAVVSDAGVVTAQKPGRCIVTASTQRTEESVIIDVLPNIEQLFISASDLTLFKKEAIPISVTYAPQKYFDDNCTWTTSDSNVAEVEVHQDGSFYIRAKEPGDCHLTCIANEGGCSVSCHVVVLDPIVEAERQAKEIAKKKRNIDIACMIGIPIAILTLFITIMVIALS